MGSVRKVFTWFCKLLSSSMVFLSYFDPGYWVYKSCAWDLPIRVGETIENAIGEGTDYKGIFFRSQMYSTQKELPNTSIFITLRFVNKFPVFPQGFSKISCEHGRRRRPGRFFAVSAPFSFPKGRKKAQKLQKRIVQRLCPCMNATLEKLCVFLFQHLKKE